MSKVYYSNISKPEIKMYYLNIFYSLKKEKILYLKLK